MRAVTKGRFAGVFAHAKPRRTGFFRCKVMRLQPGVCIFVSSIAERLVSRMAAGAEEIGFPFFKLYGHWCFICDMRLAHFELSGRFF